MIDYFCSCGYEYQLEDEFLGRTVKCYRCQKVGTVLTSSPNSIKRNLRFIIIGFLFVLVATSLFYFFIGNLLFKSFVQFKDQFSGEISSYLTFSSKEKMEKPVLSSSYQIENKLFIPVSSSDIQETISPIFLSLVSKNYHGKVWINGEQIYVFEGNIGENYSIVKNLTPLLNNKNTLRVKIKSISDLAEFQLERYKYNWDEKKYILLENWKTKETNLVTKTFTFSHELK